MKNFLDAMQAVADTDFGDYLIVPDHTQASITLAQKLLREGFNSPECVAAMRGVLPGIRRIFWLRCTLTQGEEQKHIVGWCTALPKPDCAFGHEELIATESVS